MQLEETGENFIFPLPAGQGVHEMPKAQASAQTAELHDKDGRVTGQKGPTSCRLHSREKGKTLPVVRYLPCYPGTSVACS